MGAIIAGFRIWGVSKNGKDNGNSQRGLQGATAGVHSSSFRILRFGGSGFRGLVLVSNGK